MISGINITEKDLKLIRSNQKSYRQISVASAGDVKEDSSDAAVEADGEPGQLRPRAQRVLLRPPPGRLRPDPQLL